MKNERVVAIRNLATHQLDLRLNDLLHVASHAFRIVVSIAVDYDPVRNSFHVEYESFEVANFKRRVVKNVEVLGPKSILLTRRNGQSGCHFPNIRREHTHSRRTL